MYAFEKSLIRLWSGFIEYRHLRLKSQLQLSEKTKDLNKKNLKFVSSYICNVMSINVKALLLNTSGNHSSIVITSTIKKKSFSVQAINIALV